MKDKVLPVSIVIPVRNEQENIKVILESIKRQTYQPYEVIVSDAHSEDDTRKISKEYGAKVVDGGIPAVGRNNGFNAAEKDIVIFMDADVQFLGENDFKEIVDEFVGKNLDCATSQFEYTGERSFNKDLATKFINVAKNLSAMNPIKGLKWDYAGFVIVTRNAFASVGGFVAEFKYMEDTLLIQKIVSKGFKYRIIKKKVGLVVTGRNERDGSFLAGIKAFLAGVFGIISISLVRFPLTRNFGYKVNNMSSKLYGTLGGVVKYENPYKPKDKDGGFPKGISPFLRRFYEFIPGLVMWIFLLSPFIFALKRWDQAFAIYIAFLVAYWSLRTVKYMAGITIGLRRKKLEMATDWINKIDTEIGESSKRVRFMYLCPVVSESLDTLEPAFEAWSNSDIGADRIDVVIAMEERKKDVQIAHFEHLKQKYGKKFGSMQYYIHPAGIEGEVIGVKGANINWAARHFAEDLEKQGKDIANYMVITCDSDLRPHPKYLSAVLYKYLTVEDRDNTFYASAVHTFNNNIWRVPPLIRAQSNMLTLVLLQSWVVYKYKRIPFIGERIYVRDTFSSYVVNLKTLKEIEFWDPEIANDDTAFYWNAMVRSKGTFKSQEVYIPTYNDAVENESFVKTHVSYYKQQHRWGWGSVNVAITMASLFSNKSKDFPIYRRAFMLKNIFEYQVWYMTVVFILSFGLIIMGWLSPSYQYTVLAYNLQKALSYIFTIITLTNIPIVIFRRQLSPVPKDWKWWRHLLDFAETFLVTINMLTFGFIPYVQAQTEMMLGLAKFKRNFYVTEKVKMTKKA
ncbi:MAG: glycosyltransferase [Clostridiales bacterium]|nr:glycosyltransferase [Clostridiales bacterium]